MWLTNDLNPMQDSVLVCTHCLRMVALQADGDKFKIATKSAPSAKELILVRVALNPKP